MNYRRRRWSFILGYMSFFDRLITKPAESGMVRMPRLLKFAFVVTIPFLAAAAAHAQGIHLKAVLIGGNELGGSGSPTAYGTVAIHFRTTTQFCAGIIITGLTAPTGAHIHEGFAPSNGPIIFNLPLAATGNPGSAGGCVTITPEQSVAIRTNPRRFYVNIHTAQFPGGAIRGQLEGG